MSPNDPRHGTNAGYLAHFAGPQSDAAPCPACRSAHAEYRRRLRARRYIGRVDALYIDATGTTRRIRALQALGWPLYLLDQELGHGDGRQRGGCNYVHNLTRQPRVHIDTAAKIDALFRRLSMSVGPSGRARAVARRKGYAPPLAWDDIDDPDEQPKGHLATTDALDDVAIDRRIAGDRVPLTTTEKAEARRRWVATGRPLNELERVTGINSHRRYEEAS